MDHLLSDFALASPIASQPQSMQPNEAYGVEAARVESKETGIRRKKIKKNEYSPFHNYQKHLNNALKKIVVVPVFQN